MSCSHQYGLCTTPRIYRGLINLPYLYVITLVLLVLMVLMGLISPHTWHAVTWQFYMDWTLSAIFQLCNDGDGDGCMTLCSQIS